MTEADILATTYWDKCDVFRKEKIKQTNGTTTLENNLIFENIPCALSVKNVSSNFKKEEEVGTAKYNYIVYFKPDIDLIKGDKLKITNTNQETRFFLVTETHYQISCRVCAVEEAERI